MNRNLDDILNKAFNSSKTENISYSEGLIEKHIQMKTKKVVIKPRVYKKRTPKQKKPVKPMKVLSHTRSGLKIVQYYKEGYIIVQKVNEYNRLQYAVLKDKKIGYEAPPFMWHKTIRAARGEITRIINGINKERALWGMSPID